MSSIFLKNLTSNSTITSNPIRDNISSALSFRHIVVSVFEYKNVCVGYREYHDGRPRGPLWRGKKLIGKEALYVISGLKRFKDDEEKLPKFIKTHVLRLLKMDLIAVLTELERQQEVSLALIVFFSLPFFKFVYPFILVLVACNLFVIMLMRNCLIVMMI
jgi:hypothetical protein